MRSQTVVTTLALAVVAVKALLGCQKNSERTYLGGGAPRILAAIVHRGTWIFEIRAVIELFAKNNSPVDSVFDSRSKDAQARFSVCKNASKRHLSLRHFSALLLLPYGVFF